jgi:hypothetical protein
VLRIKSVATISADVDDAAGRRWNTQKLELRERLKMQLAANLRYQELPIATTSHTQPLR